MTTQAVLAALLALRSSVAGLKKPLKSPKGTKQPLLAKLPADLGFLGDLIPEAVSPTTANKLPHRPTQLQAAIFPVDSSIAELMARCPASLMLLKDHAEAPCKIICYVQVDVGLKQLSCHFMGGGIGVQHGLEAFAQANALQLRAQKPLRARRSRRQRQQQSSEAQALYIINFTTGSLQVAQWSWRPS